MLPRLAYFAMSLILASLAIPPSAEAGSGELRALLKARPLPKTVRNTAELPKMRGKRLRSTRSAKVAFQAMDKAVKSARQQIDSTEDQIATLETRQVTKRREADGLVTKIEARRKTVQRNRQQKVNNGLLLAIFGMPAPVVMAHAVGAMMDDSVIAQLSTKLDAAKRDRSSIERELTRYRAQKEQVRDELIDLRHAEGRLDRLWKLGASSASLRNRRIELPPEIALRFSQLRRGRALVRNLEQQIALVMGVQASALRIDRRLDDHLRNLRVDLRDAKRAVERSNKQLIELMRVTLDPDPRGAAERWIARQVEAQTTAMLKQLGLHLPTHIRRFAKRAIPGDDAVSAALRKKLIKDLSRR